jgi:hypothetical protein
MKAKNQAVAVQAAKAAKLAKQARKVTSVKPAKAEAEVKAQPVRSLLYIHTRGTPLYAGNLRLRDFTAQNFERGKLNTPKANVITFGSDGVAASFIRSNRNIVDLEDGRLFDLTGIKQHEVLKAGPDSVRYAKKNGKAHTIQIKTGARKGTHTGYIIGQDWDKMNLAFINKDGSWSYTLNTRSLPKGRNAHHTFDLVK